VSGSLVALTLRAASDEVNYPFVHFWPPKVSPDELDRFVLPHVPGGLGVVFRFQDCFDEALVFRDPEHVLPVE